MTYDPFKAVVVKAPPRTPNLREAFRTIGSTPVTSEWLRDNIGINQHGMTLIEVLIMKLYKRALEEEDYAALDRIMKFCDDGGNDKALVNVNIGESMEHGAKAIFERLQRAASGKPIVEETEYEEIPEF